MTLERHRSKLIPDVEYGGDGTLYVTDREGTFPLRGKEGGRTKRDIRDMDFGTINDTRSYGSFDPERDRRRKFKQRPSRYGAEIQTLSGTVSTASSHSLGRRLRRTKNQKYPGSEDGRYDSKRLRKGSTPRMTPEFAATLLRDKRARSLDSGSLRRKTGNKDKGAFPEMDYNGNGKLPLVGVSETPLRHRRIHEERLPYIIPLVVGPGLLLVGIFRLVISYWHEYFCDLWTGALLLTLGIIGARHKGSYLEVAKNAAYILFALLSAIATLLSTIFVLNVLVRILKLLAESKLPAQVATQVEYTNMGKNLVPITLDVPIMTWLSVALDVSSMCLLLVGFYSLTAAMIAIGNHWDAAFDTTSDCDHRGNPRIFNPLEQVSLGQATTFIGVLAIVVLRAVGAPHNFFWSPAWAGVLVMLAGFATMFFGKRADKCSLCGLSTLGQLLALGGVGVATVFIVLAMVKDVTSLMDYAKTKGSPMPSMTTEMSYMALTSTVVEGVYAFVAIVNIIFIVGSLFRNCRQACASCTEDKENNSDVSIAKN